MPEIISLLLRRPPQLPPPKPSSWKAAFPFLFLAFSVGWTALVFFGTYQDYRELSSALREERCQISTCIASEFHTGPKGESFTVGGHHFWYSSHVATAGFNETATQGGPIREGICVRVHHVGNEIAKLEIAH